MYYLKAVFGVPKYCFFNIFDFVFFHHSGIFHKIISFTGSPHMHPLGHCSWYKQEQSPEKSHIWFLVVPVLLFKVLPRNSHCSKEYGVGGPFRNSGNFRGHILHVLMGDIRVSHHPHIPVPVLLQVVEVNLPVDVLEFLLIRALV